jgi:hypothetical protein
MAMFHKLSPSIESCGILAYYVVHGVNHLSTAPTGMNEGYDVTGRVHKIEQRRTRVSGLEMRPVRTGHSWT